MSYPEYSLGERLVDGAVHVVSVGFAIGAVIALMVVAIPEASGLALTSLLIYGIGLTAVFSFSAAYHLVPKQGWKELLRRLDHATIFVMIAGTYTPFALVKMGDTVGPWLLAAVWAVASVGVAIKLFLPIRRFRTVSLALYLMLGWAVILTFEPFLAAVSVTAGVLVVVGGALYTIGVGFYLWKSLPYQNAIWHVFVLAAAVCHFVAIFADVALAG